MISRVNRFRGYLRCAVVAVSRASPIVRCDQCHHWFLRYDARSFVRWQAKYDACCPVCALFDFAGGDAWAIWNDCQGAFTDAVFSRRQEAETDLERELWAGTDSYVVPVKVLREPEWRADLRAFEERLWTSGQDLAT
jgi:hypothetical protein